MAGASLLGGSPTGGSHRDDALIGGSQGASEPLVGGWIDPQGANPMVWMLDDDIHLCELVGKYLRENLMSFNGFTDIRAFEESLLGGTPDVLILDRMLPVRSGMDVLISLRQANWGLLNFVCGRSDAPRAHPLARTPGQS
jgi:hypothetical protein